MFHVTCRRQTESFAILVSAMLAVGKGIDPEKGVLFESYARWHVQRYVRVSRINNVRSENSRGQNVGSYDSS